MSLLALHPLSTVMRPRKLRSPSIEPLIVPLQPLCGARHRPLIAAPV